MPTKSIHTGEWTIESLTKEFADAPKRVPSLIPKDDWWFPPYVPSWARMLSREMYMAIASFYQAIWMHEDMIRRLPKAKRGRPSDASIRPVKQVRGPVGRPLEYDLKKRVLFIDLVDEVRAGLKQEGKRSGDSAALKKILNRDDINTERVRLTRDRKLYKIKK